MSKTQFEHLFAPLQVGPMRVPNRICETTNTINSSMIPGEIDENFREHHGAKARGGTGWIGSETWLLNLPFPPETPDEIGLSVGFASHFAAYQNPAFPDGMAKFIDEVHEAGAVAVIQLTHLSAVWAPSSVPVVGAQDYTPHVLGDEEIEFCLNTYSDAASVAKDVGADGVQIHCAHETLPYSFLSPATNQRTDKWGGGPRAAHPLRRGSAGARPQSYRQLARVGYTHYWRGVSAGRRRSSRNARDDLLSRRNRPARFRGHRCRSLLGCAFLCAVVVLWSCRVSRGRQSGARRPGSENRRHLHRAHQRPRCGGGAAQGRVLRSGGHGASGYRRSRIRQQGTRGPFDGDTPLHQLHSLYRRGGRTRDLSLRADLLHQSGRRP